MVLAGFRSGQVRTPPCTMGRAPAPSLGLQDEAPAAWGYELQHPPLRNRAGMQHGSRGAALLCAQVVVAAARPAERASSPGTEVYSSRVLPYAISCLSYCSATQQVQSLAGALRAGRCAPGLGCCCSCKTVTA